jgi:hypothetical protein
VGSPWGEVRFSSSANPGLPTDYTFTGQRSYMDDPTTNGVREGFGLMFYNARWYDPPWDASPRRTRSCREN